MSVPYDACLDALVTLATGLSLTSADGVAASVVRQKTPIDDGDFTLPAVVLSYEAVAEAPAGEAFDSEGRDAYGYGVWVRIIDHSDPARQADESTILSWRSQLMLKMTTRTLPGVASVIKTTLEPGPALEPGLITSQYTRSSFVVRCLSIESRTP